MAKIRRSKYSTKFIITIKDEILDQIDIAYNLLKYLLENYKLKICERYKIDENKINEILDRNEDEGYNNIYDIMLIIGKNRGALMSGGKVDEEKTSRLILDDFRTGRLGNVIL